MTRPFRSAYYPRSVGDDADVFPLLWTLDFENNLSVHFRKQGMVLTATHVHSIVERGSSLPHDDAFRLTRPDHRMP